MIVAELVSASRRWEVNRTLRLLGEAIAEERGGLRVILGSDISGAPYSALTRVGFLICESESIGDDYFDELFEENEADEDEKKIEAPRETRPVQGNDEVCVC